MKKYMKADSMPWLAIPFNDPAAKRLIGELKVNGIPTLAVFDKNGKLLSADGRWDVVLLKEKAVNAWKSSKYKPLTYQDYKSKLSKGSSRDNKKSSKKSKKK